MNHIAAAPALVSASIMDGILGLVPEIARRADEIEASARVPEDLLHKIEDAGGFRMCLPARFGGGGFTITEAAHAMEAVAAADASVAWHMMVAAGSQVITSRLPLPCLQEYYAHGPDTWPKAAAAPKGIAVPVEGGYRLSGRWQLASGARAFDWVSLGFFIKDENGLRKGKDGMRPDLRVCLIPRAGVEVIETWDAVGLRGTRSDDLACKDVFVPEAWQSSMLDRSSFTEPLYAPPMPACNAPYFGAIAMGILFAAIRDLVDNALVRKPAFNPMVVMKDEPVFLAKFGELVTRADGLKTLHEWTLQALEGWSTRSDADNAVIAARISSAETLIHQEATVLMNEIVLLGGSGAVYATNLQQRRWRDLRCAAQHVAANIGNYGIYAAAMMRAAAHHR